MTASTARSVSGQGRHRGRRDERGSGWGRPYVRVQRALDASQRLIHSTLRRVASSKRCAHRRPVGVSRELGHATHLLITASARIGRAAQQIEAMRVSALRDPRDIEQVPQLLVESFARWASMCVQLTAVAGEVTALHHSVTEGVQSGALVPEREALPRPRIILIVPSPAPVRAFLELRRPCVSDRISPLLRRRRRTPRPASIRVPHRPTLGRAPPLSPCAAL